MDGRRREEQNRRGEHREVAEAGGQSVREGEVAMREAFEVGLFWSAIWCRRAMCGGGLSARRGAKWR